MTTRQKTEGEVIAKASFTCKCGRMRHVTVLDKTEMRCDAHLRYEATHGVCPVCERKQEAHREAV